MRKKPRSFRPPTPESLAGAALAYLGRYAASEAALRRVLETRIRKACLRDPAFARDEEAQEKLRRAIGDIIEKHRKSGILNDTAYAEIKIGSLRRAGRSRRMIAQKLAQAGVKKEIVAEALAGADGESDGDAEMAAALKLARRKKIGPFRQTKSADPAQYKKDIAVLARAGFALDTARRVLKLSATTSATGIWTTNPSSTAFEAE